LELPISENLNEMIQLIKNCFQIIIQIAISYLSCI